MTPAKADEALSSPRESSDDEEEEDEVFERNILKNGKRFAGVFSHIFDKVSFTVYDHKSLPYSASLPEVTSRFYPSPCLQYDREFDSDESGAEEIDLADAEQLEFLDKRRAGMYTITHEASRQTILL